ncbi:conjugal transfer protein [Streptomyces sp. NPDC048606]|uniref:conjugal transfer protein n=1 Tax=Streptomyces sp. NPDC048606 TaxID=3154726 RepID=UPI003428375F
MGEESMGLGPTVRRVLGLPDVGDWERKRSRAKAKKQTSVPARPTAVGNPWEVAAAQLRAEQTPPPSAPAAVSGAPAEPWQTVDESSGAAFARRFGRGLLWALVGVLVLLGVKSLVVSREPAAPAAAPGPSQSTPAYPVEEAQAVASRFARLYLTWDEKDAGARAASLATLLPQGADTAAGWNGKGVQEVLAVQPSTVTPAAQQQGRVRVEVLIRSAALSATPSPAGQTTSPAGPVARWVGLDVPVIQAGGRVVVSGPPGLVGVPAAGPQAPAVKGPEADAQFSEQTAETITRFFRTYAGGDTDTVTAPGATVPALPAGVSLGGVLTWTADKGAGADRVGTARVAWLIAGAQLDQTYRIRLTRVASADAERWQVAAVTGGTA